MSQSSLYHEHGISVYRYQSTFYQNGKTYVRIYLPRKEYRHPCCGSDRVWVKETVVREFRSVPADNREFIIVADLLGVSWATIRDIEKEYLGKHFANPSLKGVKYIAIDEIATKKGHVSMTIVLDLETGLVLYVGEGRDQKA